VEPNVMPPDVRAAFLLHRTLDPVCATGAIFSAALAIRKVAIRSGCVEKLGIGELSE